MSLDVFIKKESSGNDIFSGYDNSQIEERSTINVEEGLFKDVLVEFNHYLTLNWLEKQNYQCPIVLSSKNINLFLQITPQLSQGEKSIFFLNELIKASYLAGNKKFYFDTKGVEDTNVLCSKVSTKGIDYLTVMVDGDVGDHFCFGSRNIFTYINGNVGKYFGQSSSHCFTVIKGDAGYGFGKLSRYLTAYVQGSFGQFLGQASSSLDILDETEFKESPQYLSMIDEIKEFERNLKRS